MDQLITNVNRLQKEKISVENKIRDNRNALNEYEQISKKSKKLLESILEVFHNSSDASTFQEIYHSQKKSLRVNTLPFVRKKSYWKNKLMILKRNKETGKGESFNGN